MHIHELVLEITRRCNIQCQHCLRGHAQSKNMSFKTLRQALSGVDSIGTVTFTGGEPSLNVPFIRYFNQYVLNMRISLDSFYVITNGKIASTSLKDALVKLSWACNKPESCGLFISQDNFHKKLGYSQWNAMDLYEDLPFFDAKSRRGDITMPLDEGLAKENGYGVRGVDINHPVILRDEDDQAEGIEDTVYVNALGDVIPSCDMSYESQELEKMGNVYDKSIEDIITTYVSQLEEVA